MSHSKIVRYIVRHEHQLNRKMTPENAVVSYSNSLADGLQYDALSLAKHTASRYFGQIYAEHSDGTETLVKTYQRRKARSE